MVYSKQLRILFSAHTSCYNLLSEGRIFLYTELASVIICNRKSSELNAGNETALDMTTVEQSSLFEGYASLVPCARIKLNGELVKQR